MKKLLLVSACLWALASSARAQAGPPSLVVVRIVENNLGKSTVLITRGENKSEQLVFDSGFSDKKLVAGNERYYKLLAGLYQEGYKLTSTFSTAAGVATLLFAKEQ